MRICSILLENINSLVGIWKVDFRTPFYEENGLFAITGPTGAGKSTLLDALCLGLYGRTPRLESISKKTNEVMSRQKGECRAEVVFEVSRGTFKASWGQHRADRNPRGNLQQPWRELADCRTGEILASSVDGVKAGVEELTGMDFSRFTRSVLLAQGGFATFLKASASEKAPLLEQITGTDLYSRFSIYVHERRKREQEILREIENRSGGMELLSPEDRKALQEEYCRILEEEKELVLRGEEFRRGREWRSTLERLEKEIRETEEEQLCCSERRKHAEGDLLRLRRGQMALTLEARYAALENARKDRENLECKVASLEKERKALEELLRELRQKEEEAASRAEEARKNREEKRPLLEECRLRDEELRSLEERRKEALELLEKKEGLREQHREERRTLEERHEESREKLEAHARFFREHGEDASLEESFALLREKWEQYGKKERRKRIFQEEKAAEEKKLEARKRERDVLVSELEELSRKKKDLETLREEERQKLEALLEGEDVVVWRTREDLCRKNLRWIEEMAELLKCQEALEKDLETLRKGRGEEENRKEDLLRSLEQSEKLLAQMEERYGAQEKLLHLSLRVASLEEERSRLAEGLPCPLCGSLEHPYRKESVLPFPEKEEKTLEKIREEQRREGEHRRILERSLAALESRLDAGARETERLEKALASAKSRREILEGELSSSEISSHALTSEGLLQSLEALRKEETSLKERLERVEALRNLLEDLEKRERFENRELQEKEKSATSLTFTVQKAKEEVKRYHQEQENLEEELRSLERNLRSLLGSYGKIPEEKPLEEALFENLEHRKNAWKERTLREEEEKLRFRGLEERRENLKSQENLMEKELEELGRDAEQRRERLEKKRRERLALYGGDPRRELEELEKTFEKTQKEHRELTSRKMELSGKEAVFEASRKKEEENLEEARNSEILRGLEFQRALEKSSFAEEGDFLAARISEEVREKLVLLQEELERKEASIKERLSRGTEALKRERQKEITPLSAEELEEEECRGAEALREKRQSLGALKAEEEKQEALSKKMRELHRQGEAQRKVLREWEELHSLVGSSDGSKFQKFVQGLTFEMLVVQANRQLQKMTDRYLLLQDPDNPLEFSVLDSYQGGEIRSSKNLSGGESFLVSLALALGLSRMIGGKNRVESLFLDEGFGSLDEETLEVALQALGELQGSCRLVGVISHVAALSERVGNQIRVIPVSGGRSRLEGPGITRRGKERD